MTITYHVDMDQGSEEWLAARCGLVTASEVKLLVTPTFKKADNEKVRMHLWELLAQRITRYVEPSYQSDAMMRGHEDELRARIRYSEEIAPVVECGFVTNDKWGFTIGCSPDGLVGSDGLIECKSRGQKFQIQTFVESIATGVAPIDYMLQLQTLLIVTERKWNDFISYSGGLPMAVLRVYPDPTVQNAIVEAVGEFEQKLAKALTSYKGVLTTLESKGRLFPTERVVEQEMI